jgi:ABC-type nitrate/sulfonate/bicarbonate transport system ATPase subunit
MAAKHDYDAVGVSIENISLSFGATRVLEGVDLVIEPSEFFTFLGPSGSGKSTLLRLIAGFGPTPSGGRVLIGGQDVTRLPPWRRNVGLVFQNYALWPHMTVRKNVAFGLEERKIPAREIRERVDSALELVELLHLAERRPSQLSGGQQQRVALARTVVVEPQVLLLDEPLSNLDANLRIQMRREIHDLQRKLELTTIFVTHDQEEANTISGQRRCDVPCGRRRKHRIDGGRFGTGRRKDRHVSAPESVNPKSGRAADRRNRPAPGSGSPSRISRQSGSLCRHCWRPGRRRRRCPSGGAQDF